MGSNIHIEHRGECAPVPASLCLDGGTTLLRFVDSWEFMGLVWAHGDCELICLVKKQCKPGEHDYYCDHATYSRPKDFEQLRKDAAHLQDWTRELIDYLERNPRAWLEYS